MNKGQVNIQDLFLNQLRKEHIPITIYLVGGVQLKGLLKGFDPFIVMLDSPGKPTQIIYKHAIASVVPTRQVFLPTGDGAREEEAVDRVEIVDRAEVVETVDKAETVETVEKDAGA